MQRNFPTSQAVRLCECAPPEM